MSMYPQELGAIPAETVRVARAACPKGTLAMRLRDALGELYQDEHFTALYPVEGQPAYAPWPLAIVTVLQYAENLTDRQAANAVRERIDWKYSLGLEWTDPGFDFSLLSEFRTRLVDEEAEFRKLYALRAGIEGTQTLGVRGMGLPRARYDGLHKTHVQHVLIAVAINLVRIDAVLTKSPRGKTRHSHFACLAFHPCWQGNVCA